MRRLLPWTLLLCTPLVSQRPVDPPVPAPQPEELGAVRWSRDLDGTLAKKPEKPVLLFFQEVPG